MKKELKRYFLVEYAGYEERVLNSKEEYEALLDIINKHNNKKKMKYIFGNISVRVENGKYFVLVNKYRKLTEKTTISELDDLTCEMNYYELMNYFKDKLVTKVSEGYLPDINIAYLEDKNVKDKKAEDVDRRIKYIPVLYKHDVMYMNKEYIFKCMAYYLRNKQYQFFFDLASEFEINRAVSEEIEALRISLDKVIIQGEDETLIYRAAKSLYEALIVERDKTTRVVRDQNGNIQISRRRKRDFGFFIRDYGMKTSKRTSPFKYNQKVQETKQTMSDEIEYDEYDRMQEEYALMSWAQQNGDCYEDYEVEYDEQQRKFIRK